MKIAGLEKLSLTDFPGCVSAIVFTQGCNFKCPFCQNSGLIPFTNDNLMTEETIFAYIEKRKNILDGIVISGGEPLLQKDIKNFIKKIREYGLKIKLDTNGTNYNLLKELIDDALIDYIAMDMKHNKLNYEKISKTINFDAIKNSIELIENSGIEYEFRTTIVKEFHNLETIEDICKIINRKSKYYLQNYVDSELVLEKGLHGFSDDELKIFQNLKSEFPNLAVRGI